MTIDATKMAQSHVAMAPGNHEHILSPTTTKKECKAAADIPHCFLALERTFLAYIRTSVMVAMQGVLIAQLFRLQHLASPDPALGFYEVGVPLAVSCYSVAILIAAMGAYRFWKQQNVVALGTVYAGGWELNCIGVLIGLVSWDSLHLCPGILLTLVDHFDDLHSVPDYYGRVEA